MRQATRLMCFLLLLAAAGAARAQQETEVQRRACEPDVWKLCGMYIPDRNRIIDCLHQNYQNLSSACRAVFDGRLR